MGLARRLDEISKKSATARVGLAGDKEAQLQLDRLDMKLLTTGRRVVDPKISVDGAAKASLEITGLDVQLDKLSAKSAEATAATGTSGLSGAGGMGALIGAGAALSPVLVTVGFGLAGFAAAGAGAVAPIMKAAHAAGGLRANMAKLGPEQQILAQSILGLGVQYRAFEKSLEPQVLSVFGKGVQIAGHLMKDMQPIAQATGKALDGLLGAVDKELASGTWQQFFGFMARTAGPDVKLLTANLVDMMQALPPLLEAMQPVATEVLQLTDDILKATGVLTGWVKEAEKLPPANTKSADSLNNWAVAVTDRWIPGAKTVNHWLGSIQKSFLGTASSTGNAAQGMTTAGDAAAAAKAPVFNLATAVKGLTDAMAKNVGEVLTLQGDEIAWRQSLQAATAQLHSNSAGLDGNTKNALANKAAVLAATQNVMTFADDQLTLGGNLNTASRRIQEQIHWLQVHGEHSKFARDEIRALRLEEDKLRATIRQRLIVSGTGTWHIAHGLGARGTGVAAAAGTLVTVGTTPTADDVLARVSKGEAIVPAHLVPPLAPFLKANKVPGFAAGGFAGTVPGLGKWLASEDSSTLRALEAAVAGAVKGALAGMGGFGSGGGALGGDAGANQALARRMYPPWGSGAQWAAWNLLNMAESGWNRLAKNPTSGAYGIPQALPPTKMPWAAQEGGGSHAGPQIGWQLGYISSTYRDPIGAWAHERAFNWYDSGTQYLPRGLSLAMNATGRPERVGGEDLGPKLDKLIKQTGRMIALLERAPGLQAAATTRALNGLVSRIPAPRARGR